MRPGASRAIVVVTGRSVGTGSVFATEEQVTRNRVRVSAENRVDLRSFLQTRGLWSSGVAVSQTTPPHSSTSTTRTTSGGNPGLPSYRTTATTSSGRLTRRNLSPARRLLRQVRTQQHLLNCHTRKFIKVSHTFCQHLSLPPSSKP